MKQIDIAMTVKEKILEYLKGEDGYRSVSQIAEAVGSNNGHVRKVCADIYWNHGKRPFRKDQTLQRMVNNDSPCGQQKIEYRRQKSEKRHDSSTDGDADGP